MIQILVSLSSLCYGQYIGSYTNSINGLNLGNSPVTKLDIETSLGIPTEYKIREYPDEPLGTDEYYKYVSAGKELYMMFTDGIIQEFYTDSPEYLLFGSIRIGDNVQKFRDMLANGFGKFIIEEERGLGLKTIEVKLGDETLRVTHMNNIITFIRFVTIF